MNLPARIGWLCLALATGLLLQIQVQIHGLGWLPDFPIYEMLAIPAAAAALLGLLVCIGTDRKTQWLACAVTIAFVLLAIAHAGLTLGSSSLAIQRWRDLAFWPTLLAAVAACLATTRQSWWTSLAAVWMLGESITAIAAISYAPTRGESTSWAAYHLALAPMLFTCVAGAITGTDRGFHAYRFRLAIAVVVLPLGMAGLCAFSAKPADAHGPLLACAAARGLLLIVVILRSTSPPADRDGLAPLDRPHLERR